MGHIARFVRTNRPPAQVPEAQRSKAAKNELLKAEAAMLNNLAVAIFFTGMITPILNLQLEERLKTDQWKVMFVVLFATASGLLCHFAARRYLQNLKD